MPGNFLIVKIHENLTKKIVQNETSKILQDRNTMNQFSTMSLMAAFGNTGLVQKTNY